MAFGRPGRPVWGGRKITSWMAWQGLAGRKRPFPQTVSVDIRAQVV